LYCTLWQEPHFLLWAVSLTRGNSMSDNERDETDVLDDFRDTYARAKQEKMPLSDYLRGCRDDPLLYASAAERMVKAIGEPEIIDTSTDPRLRRIFLNATIKRYPSFSAKFFGMENVTQKIVSFFTHAAQGLEESKQILYLLGPVGGGKSSLAERLKLLMEQFPIYVLAVERNGVLEVSPIFESPLGLFDLKTHGKKLADKFDINQNHLPGIASPWALKRLDELGGDIAKFMVVKLVPSRLRQIGVMKTEPGDENNQDISTLVGKVDIRRLEHFSQNDADAYSFSGGLNRTTQGLLEFVEMFKAPIKVLHPLLTATQERNYVGTEPIGPMPFRGIIVAHSNEAEWQQFKGNRNNEAFLDRINIIKVPYCLRFTEETAILQKLIDESELPNAHCAPDTLKMLAQFDVLTRLKPVENSAIFSKMRIYDGEDLKDKDSSAKTIHEYREAAGVDEGKDGIGLRFAFKVLSATLNYDPNEIAADPVHLLQVLENAIKEEQFPEEKEKKYIEFIKSELVPRFVESIGKEIQEAYLESYSEYGQNLFDRYIAYADAWIEEQDFKDPDTGQMFNREMLDTELSKIEKPSGVANPKDFRNEIVKFSLRARAANSGKNPSWRSYQKLRTVIERRIFSQVEEILPVISFGEKKDEETRKKHSGFVERMVKKGYTERQVRRLVEWYIRVKKSG